MSTHSRRRRLLNAIWGEGPFISGPRLSESDEDLTVVSSVEKVTPVKKVAKKAKEVKKTAKKAAPVKKTAAKKSQKK